ncbi:MAG: NAD(P)-binding protein [Rhodobacteraceae bacterium]|nr:NAD(P)-binding protein [Paracoccaceae bacterium]
MTSCDAIVIGGGHNGLTAATVLAKAGRRVMLFEAGALGGTMATVEVAPGYRSSALSHLVNRLAPEVVAATGLEMTCLAAPPAPTVVLGDGDPVILRGGYGARLEGVGAEEALAFASLRAKLMGQAAILGRMLGHRPPMPGDFGLGDAWHLGLTGLAVLRKGRAEARDLMRMILTNVADVADEYLTDDRLKGLLSFDATLGAHLGPRSPGSLLGLHYRLTGSAGGVAGGQIVPRGGMGTLAAAFVSAAERAGVELRPGTRVARIEAVQGRATAVTLAGGEVVSAPVIVSAIHPGTTFLRLVDPAEIDTGLTRAFRRHRSKGNVAKLNLALNHIPAFGGLAEADLAGRIVIARSTDHVESAFNPAKYGAFSPDPAIEVVLPSLGQPEMAAKGCTLSALIQFAPYDLKEGWAGGAPRLLDTVLDILDRHAPGLRAGVIAADLLPPTEIEARCGLPGGHWHHGEMTPDQLLFNRPVHAAAGYATPLDGLFLASAGSHPGGGISGLPGLNAARHVLEVAR